MIIHVFTANRYHLVPAITKGLIEAYSDTNFKLILFGNKSLDKQKYIDIYNDYEFLNYEFCQSLKEFAVIIRKYKNNPILFHAGSYSWFLIAIILGCRNINWVCWGAGASTGKSFKSKLINPLKKYIYNRFQSIVTLMEADKNSIAKDFNVPINKITTIPYGFTFPKFQDLYLKLIEGESVNKNNEKPIVLLGNNSSNINEYINLLHVLEKYKGKIKVQCMLHYSLNKNELYYKLIELGNSIFGDDFRSNEEFYDFESYIYYMNKCTVYICGATKQSGLGAIYTCLCLGKKIYIKGKNYEWVTSFDSIVFKLEEITRDTSFDEFIKDIPYKTKIHNNNCIYNHKLQTPEKWKKYFSTL